LPPVFSLAANRAWLQRPVKGLFITVNADL
jgi:hypothetical protein